MSNAFSVVKHKTTLELCALANGGYCGKQKRSLVQGERALMHHCCLFLPETFDTTTKGAEQTVMEP